MEQMKELISEISYPGIEGNLQVISDTDEEGTVIYLDGDRLGLLSLARLATQLANFDQSKLEGLPSTGASEHVHLKPNVDMAASSSELVIGRLDQKHGDFDETFRERAHKETRAIVHRWGLEKE